MKIYSNRHIQTLFILSACMLFLNSCLKDSGPVQDFSQSPPVVSFQGNGLGNNTSTFAVLSTTDQNNPAVDSFGISLGVASLYLSKPVTVTIAADQASLDAYNTANGTSYTMLSSDQYAIQDGGSWVIPSGKNLKYFNINFFGSNIDFTKDNALALKITDAPGTTIASNLDTYILHIVLRSLYEGDYNADGTITRYSGSTEASGVVDDFPISGPMKLATVNANTVDGTLPIAGFAPVEITLTVNNDNSVTITPSVLNPGVPAQNNPAKASSYDPATKTFDIHGFYLNGAGALREFDCTLTLQ